MIQYWPQGLILLIFMVQLCVYARLHGTRSSTPYSFWGRLSHVVLMIALLYAGGFFL